MNPLRRLAPVTSRAWGRVGRREPYQAAARRSWELCPAESFVAPSALFEPADLARVTGVAPDSSGIANEIARAHRRAGTHFATTAHELSDVVISAGHAFTWKTYLRLNPSAAPMVITRDLPEQPDSVLASTLYGAMYFAHWMIDDLPLQLAAAEVGRPVTTLLRPTPSQCDFATYFDMRAETVTEGYFRRLVIIDDVGNNAYKRRRIEAVRGRARAFSARRRHPGVMLLRKSSGARRILLNEDDIATLVERRGLTVMDPSRNSAAELLEACGGADVVIGVEGSQLANGMLCMEAGGTLVTLQSPIRFTLVLKAYCDAIGARYGFVVGDDRDGDFVVDPDGVDRMLDRVVAERRR